MSDIFFRIRHLEPPFWLLVLLMLIPLVLTWGKASPPWPGGIGWVTAALNPALALVFARIAIRHPDWINKLTITLVLITASLCLIAYLLLFSRYTFVIPTTGEIGVKGFLCTQEAIAVYPEDCPGDDREALGTAEFESPRIWLQWTIDTVRLGLLCTWQLTFTMFCWLSACLAPRSFGALLKKAPPAYEGNGGYYFMSYAHSDMSRILPVLDRLHAKGYRIWFDKGIPGASAWDEQLSTRLRECLGVIAFLSPASLGSKWVQREILFADDLEKPLFCVRLADCELPPPLDLRLVRNQIIEGNPDFILTEFERAFNSTSHVVACR